MSGSVRVTRFERDVETTTVNGTTKAPHVFVRLDVETPNGVLQLELDAGDFSRLLAEPGVRQPCLLSVG